MQDVDGVNIVDVAVASGMCKSKGEARRLIESGGMYINNVRVPDVNVSIESASIIEGRILVLRSGRKKFFLVKIV